MENDKGVSHQVEVISKNRVHGMVRSIDQWRGMSPKAVLAGSEAQSLYALQAARHDILAMWSVLATLTTKEE